MVQIMITARRLLAAAGTAAAVAGSAYADGLWLEKFASTATDGTNPTGAPEAESFFGYHQQEGIGLAVPSGVRQLTGRLRPEVTGYYEFYVKCPASSLVVVDGTRIYFKENNGSDWSFAATEKTFHFEAGMDYPLFIQLAPSKNVGANGKDSYFTLQWRHAETEEGLAEAVTEKIPAACLSQPGGDAAQHETVATDGTFGDWRLDDFNVYADGATPTGAAYLHGTSAAFDLRLVGAGTDRTGFVPADTTNGFVHFSRTIDRRCDFVFEALIANPKQPWASKTVDGKAKDAYDVVGLMVRGGSGTDAKSLSLMLAGGGNRKPFVSWRAEDGGAVLSSASEDWVGAAPRPIRFRIERRRQKLTCYIDGEQAQVWDGTQNVREFRVGKWTELQVGLSLSSYNFPKTGAAFIQDVSLTTKQRDGVCVIIR